jgi:hypothetical protein
MKPRSGDGDCALILRRRSAASERVVGFFRGLAPTAKLRAPLRGGLRCAARCSNLHFPRKQDSL